MNILDWILISWLVAAFFVGARIGLVYHIGSCLGLLVGFELAGRVYEQWADRFGGGPTAQLILFTGIAVGVAVIMGVTARVLDKIFKFVSWLPFLKTFNRLGGALIAALVDILFTGTVLFFSSQIHFSAVLEQTMAESIVAQVLIIIGRWVALLLPGIVL